ncbi:MAG: hypothetical protein KTR31_04485 [Myxococcales bacterium]|nr:hypothetical protein [Myxococcales bacterium]
MGWKSGLATLLAVLGLGAAWLPVDLAVIHIAAVGRWESESVGYDGAPSPSWVSYLALRLGASKGRLRELLQHASPAVRAYAVQAIVAREGVPDDVESWLAEVLEDRAELATRSGCVSSQTTVAELASWTLLSADPPLEVRELMVDQLLSQSEPPGVLIRLLRDSDVLTPTRAQRLRGRMGLELPGLLATLASLREEQDVPTILEAYDSAPVDALRATVRFPHPAFLDELRADLGPVLADSGHAEEARWFWPAVAAYGVDGLGLLEAALDRGLDRAHLEHLGRAVNESGDPALVPVLFRLAEEHRQIGCPGASLLLVADEGRALDAILTAFPPLRGAGLQDEVRCTEEILRTWTGARGPELVHSAVLTTGVLHFEVVAAHAAELRSPDVVPALLARFSSDDNAYIYLAALEALQAYEEPWVDALVAEAMPKRRADAEDWELEALDRLWDRVER